ncbi:MAG TPA: hypothetical protein VMT76_14890 [Puia sp.]|nr:hypothetical protein [Puia sp.]
MKNFLMSVLSLATLCYLVGCGKSNPANQKNNTSGKNWLVKDISSGGAIACTFNYNDKGQVTSVVLNPGAFNSATYEVVYNGQGKIDSIKFFNPGPGFDPVKIIYESANTFVAQAIPNDTAHRGITFYSWNTASENEIDEVTKQGSWISGSPYGPGVSYTDYYYDAGGGIHANSFHYIGGSTQNIWALAQAGTGPTVDNPFHKGRTNEQNFVYYSVLKAVMMDMLVMANGLPNGVFEGYADSSGVQLTMNRFYFNYDLDSNKNVSKISEYLASNRPALNQFLLYNSWNITYEQH